MRDRPHFLVPLGLQGELYEQGELIRLSADTWVIPMVGNEGTLDTIVRVIGLRSHNPSKTPCYRLSQQIFSPWDNSLKGIQVEMRKAVLLRKMMEEAFVLVQLSTTMPQFCYLLNGRWHACQTSDTTVCGEPFSTPNNTVKLERVFQRRVPNCARCLSLERAWYYCKVMPYQADLAKLTAAARALEKQRAHLRKWARKPSVYDRLLDDDLYGNPTYKPVKVLAVEPDHEDEFRDLREARLASARDKSLRYKKAKH